MARPVDYYAKKYGVPVKLARALIQQESGGRDDAVSPKNAVGRMQIHLPSHPDVTPAQARDPDFSMDYGFRLLAGHKKQFGSWRLALAAYNAGAGAVAKYKGVPPYKETQHYVRTILSSAGALTTTAPARAGAPAPAPRAPTLSTQAPVAGQPQDFKRNASLAGLQALASGSYDPSRALGELQTASRQAAEAMPPPDRPEPEIPDAGGVTLTDYEAPAGKGDWRKFVVEPAAVAGPSAHHQPAVLAAVGRIGKRAGKKLAPWPNERHSLTTVNGNRSDHGDGYAADIPAKGAELRRLGYLALLEAGMPKNEALKAARKGGLYNVNGWQIIFATEIGGNHYDHVHVRPPRG